MRSKATASTRRQQQQVTLESITQPIIERLEGRQLMAARDPFDVRNTPAFASSSDNVGDEKEGPLAKGGGALVAIYQDYTRFIKKGGNRYTYESPLADQYLISGRFVAVTMRTRGSIDTLSAQVREMGGSLIYRSKGRKVVEAYVPISQVDNVAKQPEIMHLRPILKPVSRSQGAVANLAEASMKTEMIINSFGATGAGQKVGIISDSFGGGSDADTGDVTVLQEGGGNDEGRAMIELVHDLAPDADLSFHTVGSTPLTFANAITKLREDGATVIVDDFGLNAEPFFQPGVIDRAIADVTADGASYFTAAGNDAYAGYQRMASFVPDPTGNGGQVVDFDPSSNVDTKLKFSAKASGFLELQWDDAFDGVVANIDADVDFYLYRKNTLISKAVDDNFATGVPIEFLIVPEAGEYELVIRLASVEKGAEAPSAYKFLGFSFEDDDVFDARKDLEYSTPDSASAAWGHAVSRNGGIAVGAVPYDQTEPFGVVRDIKSEPFSSGGKSLQTRDANGNRLPQPTYITTALLSGVDGTDTNTPNFAPFFGTSAAAPNVAALAAQLRQMVPDASPQDIADALVESAKQNPLNGSKAGTLDLQGGYGLVDAVAAARAINADIPTATIDVPTTTSNLSSITVQFSEPVTGVDISDFILTREGSSKNRFTGRETISASSDGRTYTIEGLSAATRTLATYTLVLRNNRTDIEDADGNLAAGQYASFDITLRRVSGLTAQKLSNGRIRVSWTDTNSGEDSYRLQRSTDAGFRNLRNIDVAAGVNSYTDSDVSPGEIYYYRVRAVKNGRQGDVATTSIVNSSAGDLFLDSKDASLRGGWATYQDDAAWMGSHIKASKTDPLKSANTATFAPGGLQEREYFVYVRYVASKNNASNASFEILRNGEVDQVVQVDQTTRGGGWVLLGKFINSATEKLSVRLTSAGANGSVAVDAMRFLPSDE